MIDSLVPKLLRAHLSWKVCLVMLLLPSPFALAQNLTPGDGDGSDHTGVTYAPFKWQADRGEIDFRWHVGKSHPQMGQQYEEAAYWQTIPGGAGAFPQPCNVLAFYNLVRNLTQQLGVLLHTGHGSGGGTIVVEPYAGVDQDFMERRREYYFGVDPGDGLGPFMPDEIVVVWDPSSQPPSWFGLAVTDTFIRKRGRLTKSLVYIATCHGGELADDFVAANARFALGNESTCSTAENRERVISFFTRMDGKDPAYGRAAYSAMQGLSLSWDGDPAVVLAPIVEGFDAPCPMHFGDTIRITFDTACDMSVAPDIECDQNSISNERWENVYTLLGTAASEPTNIVEQCVHVNWSGVKSFWNSSYLDGSTNPPPPGDPHDPDTPHIVGVGPAHDNYVWARI